MLLFVIPIVIFSGYKIDRKKHNEILKKLKFKRRILFELVYNFNVKN